MKNINNEIQTLIIPDVHGRDFWRDPVKQTLENTNARIVFLGDYLDPYPDEGITKEKAIQVFNEIIEHKKNNTERITLLLGNHDCTYRFGKEFCECRTDYANYDNIRQTFLDNKDLFQLSEELFVNDKHFILSHAGIHEGYVKTAFPSLYDGLNGNNIVDFFNNAYHDENENVITSLKMYDSYRGWFGSDYGSIVWADMRSWFSTKEIEGFGCYQVFGHTQLNHDCGGYICENSACLDSAEAFIITNEGKVKPWIKL